MTKKLILKLLHYVMILAPVVMTSQIKSHRKPDLEK